MLLPISFVVVLVGSGFAQAPDAEAQAAFEAAEEHVARGRYAKAWRAFRKLAERHPDTAAGRAAAERSRSSGLLGWSDLVRHGPSANRVDVVVMGDGYPLDEQDHFHDVAADVPREFERDEVFGEYYSYLNLIEAHVISEEKGLDGYGRQAATALGGTVLLGANAEHVTVDAGAVNDLLRALPEQDGYAVVFVPLGSVGSAVGGVATIGGGNPRALLHEWGHAFARLGDEYATYTGLHGPPASNVNVATSEETARLPWKHFLAAGVPGVGAYEGASGRVRDAWRPTASGCRMNDGEIFCPVCREALVLRIHEHVDPIDLHRVRSQPDGLADGFLSGDDPHELEVVVLTPTSHAIEVSWWILRAEDAPEPVDHELRPRSRRGPLERIDAKPDKRVRASKTGVHRLRVDPRKLDAGRYRVVFRAVDTTQPRGERFPWVLRDPSELLRSERGWWLEVRD